MVARVPEFGVMASRPYWKGHLRLSLVSCPVALYTATTSTEKVSFHLLNRENGHRLRRLMVDGETGEAVESAEQMRGYEVSKGDYVTFENDELDGIALESTHTIDIDAFVPRADIGDVYLDSPYYMAPNEKIGEDAFAVIRDAMKKRGMAGLGRVVMNRRERVVMLEPSGPGIVATTLRFPYEIKDADDVFGAIPKTPVPAEMLALADHIIDTKKREFEPEAFVDRYESALRDLIAAKQKGLSPKHAAEPAAASNVVDLMEALRRSVAGQPTGSTDKATKGKSAPPKKAAAAKAHAADKQKTGAAPVAKPAPKRPAAAQRKAG